MFDRRNFLAFIAGASLAGCSATGSFPVAVNLPPTVTTFISNANDIVAKIESLGSSLPSSAAGLLSQAKTLIGQISGGGDATLLGSTLLDALGTIAGLLPPPWGTVAVAVETVIPVVAKLVNAVVPASVAARPASRLAMAMTPDAAWAVIRSR